MKKKKGVPIIYSILLFVNMIVWILGIFFSFAIPNERDRIIVFLAILLGDGGIVFTMFLLSFTIERLDKIEEKLDQTDNPELPNDTSESKN